MWYFWKHVLPSNLSKKEGNKKNKSTQALAENGKEVPNQQRLK
jgi:hypothetical protein